MNLHKKNIRKTSGIHNKYKPGQLVTINHRVYRIFRTVKKYWCMNDCYICFDRNYEKYNFCMTLPVGLFIKPISKHKG